MGELDYLVVESAAGYGRRGDFAGADRAFDWSWWFRPEALNL